MARIHYYSFITNDEGQPIPLVEVSIFLAGTTTAAKIFNHPLSGTSDDTVPQLITNTLGYFEFWIGDTAETDGYENTQKFKIYWEKAGITSGYIDYVDIFPTLYEIDETDLLSIVKNKIISNRLGFIWDQHAQYDFSTSSAVDVYNTTPHGLEPANFNNNDSISNRIVSNKFLQDNYVSRDGSQFFTHVVVGVYPVNANHLSTKEYVDDEISDVQFELDNTQANAGLDPDGNYIPDLTANYIDTANTLFNADQLLDIELNNVQLELDNTQTGAGLNTDGSYTPDTSANYINTADTLFRADQLLDDQVTILTNDKVNVIISDTEWTSAGPGYEVTFTHGLNEDYPSITVWNTDTKEIETLSDIISIDANTIKISALLELNLSIKVLK